MKQLAFFLGLCLILTKNSDSNYSDCQENQYLCASNTLPMNPRLCIDLTEVPCYMYKDFMASIAGEKGTSSDEFILSKPDFTKWEILFEGVSVEAIEQRFFESDDFALMPIIGISLEQAIRFSEWRTKAMEAELAELSARERAAFPRKFKFRLPSADEWSRMRFLRQDKRMMKQLDKIAGKNRSAFKLSRSELMKGHDRISDIYASKHETVGFFNLFNNVAEMTSEPGQAVGGSWKTANTAKNYQQLFDYTGPEAWLGFRCIFEIID